MTKQNPFEDLDTLRRAGTEASASPGKARMPRWRKQQQEPFIQIPVRWAEQMTLATGTPKAFVGLWLLHLAWKTGSTTVSLSNGELRARGVGLKAKRRALLDLEGAGLIRVGRRNGRAPIVTLVQL